jgi:hypothetical protein
MQPVADADIYIILVWGFVAKILIKELHRSHTVDDLRCTSRRQPHLWRKGRADHGKCARLQRPRWIS